MSYRNPFVFFGLIGALVASSASGSTIEVKRSRLSKPVDSPTARLAVTLQTKEPGLASSVDATFSPKFDGPAPYESHVQLTPEGPASAIARTPIGFDGDPSDGDYPVQLNIGADGTDMMIVTVTLRIRYHDSASSISPEPPPGDSVQAEIVAQRDKDGDGLPDAYRLRVVATGNIANSATDVTITFQEPFEGPPPHAVELQVPFSRYRQTYSNDDLLFDGDPTSYEYEVAIQPNEVPGAPIGEVAIDSYRVRRDRSLPQAFTTPSRTAPVLAVCGADSFDLPAEEINCNEEELFTLATQIVALGEDRGSAGSALVQGLAAARRDGLSYIEQMEDIFEAEDFEARLFSGWTTGIAAPSAQLDLIDAVIRDILAGLSSEELVELMLIVDSLSPYETDRTALEIGREANAGVFLGGLNPIPVEPGEQVFEAQVVVEGYAFDASELSELLQGSSPSSPATGSVGMVIMRRAHAQSQIVSTWEELSAESIDTLPLHAAFAEARVVVAPELNAPVAEEELASVEANYRKQLETHPATLGKFDRMAGEGLERTAVHTLEDNGVFDALNAGESDSVDLTYSLGSSKTETSSPPTVDPALVVLLAVRPDGTGPAPGLSAVAETLLAGENQLLWLTGSPATSPDVIAEGANASLQTAFQQNQARLALEQEAFALQGALDVFAKGKGRQFGVSRIKFRELALAGRIPGARKASW